MTVKQQMEEVWRDARWIMDALQYARYKQPTGGISISWIIDFSKEVMPDKPPSTSSQTDFMPSPMPSPEPCRKHSGQKHLWLCRHCVCVDLLLKYSAPFITSNRFSWSIG